LINIKIELQQVVALKKLWDSAVIYKTAGYLVMQQIVAFTTFW